MNMAQLVQHYVGILLLSRFTFLFYFIANHNLMRLIRWSSVETMILAAVAARILPFFFNVILSSGRHVFCKLRPRIFLYFVAQRSFRVQHRSHNDKDLWFHLMKINLDRYFLLFLRLLNLVMASKNWNRRAFCELHKNHDFLRTRNMFEWAFNFF